LALRAVIFDYGMVLTGSPNQDAYDQMVRIMGVSVDAFEKLYWAERHPYDEGKLSGLRYWKNIVESAGLEERLGDEQVRELCLWDARRWTTQNPAMLDWQLKLKEAGLRTAILSNMGDAVEENIERELDWLNRFDARIWSHRLKIAKPDPAIYVEMLRQVDVKPEESLFIDDKQENIDAALALGMHAVLFTTVEKLRADLIEGGWQGSMPLPLE
jgi:putative hydrolase of the HAD superfamily